MALTSFLVAVLATYRMAILLSEDDGPFYIFTRLRTYTNEKTMGEIDRFGFWHMVDEGINCPYCIGLYAALLSGVLVAINNFYGNLFLLILAIAGGQSLLQKWGEKR